MRRSAFARVISVLCLSGRIELVRPEHLALTPALGVSRSHSRLGKSSSGSASPSGPARHCPHQAISMIKESSVHSRPTP
jgi:hypothetical protein